MSITGKHDDRLYFLSAHLIVKHFVCSFLTELNKTMPTDYNKLFPFGIVPMQPGDVPVTYADTTSLEQDFAFKPGTSLRDGLRNFAEWYVKFYNTEK